MATRLPNASASAAADAVMARFNAGAAAGTIDIRTGSQPATANDAATGTLLATLTLADPAAASAVNGVATFDFDPDLETTGLAAGTAGWFRGKDSDGNTVLDGSVGATGSGAQLELNSTTISVGVTVRATAGTYTQPLA